MKLVNCEKYFELLIKLFSRRALAAILNQIKSQLQPPPTKNTSEYLTIPDYFYQD